jgi:hypothetical protein
LSSKVPHRETNISSSSSLSIQKHPPNKKVQAALLASYAVALYRSLNEEVFEMKLPPALDGQSASTESVSLNGERKCNIVWSKTLKKTAGRAIISR